MNLIFSFDTATKIVQSAFYIVVASIGVLTYLSAKKTVLQPIRTELFKVQLQELSAVLRIFAGYDEISLRRQFAFDDLAIANIVAMYDAYASTFFDLKVEEGDRPYRRELCPSAIVSLEFLEPDDNHLAPSSKEQPASDPRVRAALWADYVHGVISLPKGHSEMIDKVRESIQSPLLPKECAALVERFLETVQDNVMLIGALLGESAKEMPGKYPTAESLKSAHFGWIQNRYAQKFEPLRPKAEAVIEYVRSYWEVDRLPKA